MGCHHDQPTESKHQLSRLVLEGVTSSQRECDHTDDECENVDSDGQEGWYGPARGSRFGKHSGGRSERGSERGNSPSLTETELVHSATENQAQGGDRVRPSPAIKC